MKAQTRFGIFSLVALMVFLISLVMPLAVLADDGAPPSDGDPASITSEPPAEASQTSEEAPTEEVTITSEVSVPLEEEISVAEVLEVAPEGTEVVVLDENGEVLPLVSEEAAQIVAIGDPIWCPENAAPVAGAGGCTDPGVGNVNYDPTSLASLLAYLSANQPAEAGIIWIEDSYDSDANDAVAGFTITGSIFTTMKDFDLTLQGGWSGVSGSTSITGTSFFDNDYLEILSWNADVTVNDIVISGTVDEHGLSVLTTGDIGLENVTVQYSDWSGANLNNTSGTGNVSISDSTFNNNDDTGLEVYSKGDVTVHNSTANLNVNEVGLYINNTSGMGDVSLTGTNTFNNNNESGLRINSKGNISISDLSASGSDEEHGAYISNNTGTGSVTLLSGYFNENNEKGLYITSAGTVTLYDITSIGNQSNGLFVDNSYGSASVPVFIHGTNVFWGNVGTNVVIESEGEITINNLTAISSIDGSGVDLDNTEGKANQGILLTGTNIFSNNGLSGMNIHSNGAIEFSNVTANHNQDGGVLDNCRVDSKTLECTGSGDITSTGASQFNNSVNNGLQVRSNGAISLNSITANENGNIGADLNNALFATAPQPVTLTGTNEFNSNTGNGLFIASLGDIYIDPLTVSGHASVYGGVVLVSEGDVTIDCAQFDHNALGLYAELPGTLTLDDVSFSDNTISGAFFAGSVVTTSGGCASGGGGTGGGGKKPVVSIGIPVTGGAGFPIDCTNPELFTALLENNNRAIFNLLCGYDGMLVESPLEQLPGELPEGTEFHGGMNIIVLEDGGVVQPLPEGASVTPSFVVEKEDAEYAILYWNSSEWVEVEGKLEEEDGTFYFQAEVEFTGTFVLVTK